MANRPHSAPRVLRLDDGTTLMSYPEAARRLGATYSTLVKWIGRGYLLPSKYRHSTGNARTRFIALSEVERLRAHRRQTTGRLMAFGAAANYLGISTRKLLSAVRAGRLRPAGVGDDLYAKPDLDKLRLELNGIRDPIRKSEAARLAGVTRKTIAVWERNGRLKCVAISNREAWCSASSVRRLGTERKRQLESYTRQIRVGEVVPIVVAAARLGVAPATVMKGFHSGRLSPVRFDLIKRTGVRSTDIMMAQRRGWFRHRYDLKLPRGLLSRADVEALLGVSAKRVEKWVRSGRLPVAARGESAGNRPSALGFRRRDAMKIKAERERTAGLVRSKQACVVLGVSESRLKRLVRDGLVPLVRSKPVRLFDGRVLTALKATGVIAAAAR